MRNASGNGFDSSDSFAVSGAAEGTARLHDIPPSITPSHGDDSHLLSRIASPADVKALAPNELAELCREIRTTLLAYGHQHGGHIGSNLGMVEATVALHRVFDSPRDRIVFDVSHQSYVHKMLTGRELIEEIVHLKNDPVALKRMAEASKSLGKPKAADDIAKLALSIARDSK